MENQIRRENQIRVWLSLVLPFCAFGLYLLWLNKVGLGSGIFDYYQQFYESSSRGQLPWIHFNVEYPPLSIPLIFGPALLVKGLSVAQVTTIRTIWTFILTVIGFWKLGKYEIQIRKWPISTYVLGACLLVANKLYFVYFDWATLWIIILAFICRDASQRGRLTSNLLLVFGFLTKVVPGFIYPWVNPKHPGTSWIKTHALFIGALALQVGYALFNVNGMMWAIQYHSQRSIDAFGIWGVLALILNRLHITNETVITQSETASVTGPLSAVMRNGSTVVLLVALCAGIVFAFRHRQRDESSTDNKVGWLVGLMAVLVFALFGKLGQPNYCYWIAGVATVLSLSKHATARDLAILGTSSILFCFFAARQGAAPQLLYLADVPMTSIAFGALKFAFGIPILVLCLKHLQGVTMLEIRIPEEDFRQVNGVQIDCKDFE